MRAPRVMCQLLHFYPYIEEADAAIGDTDPDDVLYVACALATDADIWSDDSDFEEQDVVEAHSRSNMIDSFDTLYPSKQWPVE